MKKYILVLVAMIAATTVIYAQPKDSSVYVRQIKPIVVGMDTLNTIVIYANYNVDMAKKVMRVNYILTNATQWEQVKGGGGGLRNKADLPLQNSFPTKEGLISNLISKLPNIKLL